jgi:mRNA-degrading endonuclease toxin of MazEF toxin-antitoxin module
MAYEQGDIVWAWLPYSNGVGGEDHPVLVVSAKNKGRDITVARLTSQVAKARRRGEYILQRWPEAGLDKASAVRPKVFVILKGRVTGRIGHLHDDDWPGVRQSLRALFGL